MILTILLGSTHYICPRTHNMEQHHIVIIGNGISGVTAARHIRKNSDHKITIISSETDHFFSRTALMYIYMGHMKYEHTKPYEDWFWEKNRIELLRAYVSNVDFGKKELTCDSGKTIRYDKLVLAVGSKPNKFGWQGQDLDGVQGLYSYQDLELLEKNTHAPGTKGDARKVKRAVLVGGGLIGVELAEMLITRNIEVTFLVRDDRFWGGVLPKEEGYLVMRHIRKHHVDLRLNTELDKILPDENGRVKSVVTKDGEEIECQLVGLTAGVRPNVEFLKDSGLEINRGILVNRLLETNQKDVYAIGDCAEQRQAIGRRRPLEQVWYTGKMMGMALAETLTGNPTEYNPGHWFNSAKFFDLEYQTYGWVMNELQAGEDHYYWQNADKEVALKVVFDQSSHELIGVNVFGIRLRHEMLDKWLTEKRTAEYLIEHLADANFDPEFYRQYEREIAAGFNEKFNTRIKPKKKSWIRIFQKAKA